MIFLLCIISLAGCKNKQQNEAENMYDCYEIMGETVVSDFCSYEHTLFAICEYGENYKLKALDLETGTLKQSEISFSKESQLIGADASTLWILEAGTSLKQYSHDNSLLLSIPCDVYRAQLGQDSLIYTLGAQVAVYSPEGKVLASANSPESAEIYPAYSGIMILDQQSHKLDWFQPDGSVSSIATLNSNQTPIYYDSNDGLWLYESDRIMHYSANGENLLEEIQLFTDEYGGNIKIIRCGTGYALYSQSKLYYITQEDMPDVTYDTEGKSKLSLAVFQPSETVRMKVAEFNEGNDQYYIEILDYAENFETADEAIQQLYLDVAVGDAPDIYCFRGDSGYGITPYILQSKNALADFKSFFSSDEELQEDLIIPNLLSALEVNGALYELPVSYRMNCMLGRTETVEGIVDMSLDEFQRWINQCGDPPFGGTSVDTILAWILAYNIENYVNYADGTCDFDCASFQSILEIMKAISEMKPQKADNIELITQGKQFFEFASIGTFQMMQYYRKLFQTEKLSFSGIPGAVGENSSFLLTLSFGISNTTAYPDVAWMFVRQFILADYQDKQTTFPVTAAEFQKRLQNPERYETEPWEAGNIDITIEVDIPTDADCLLVSDLLQHTTSVYNMDYQLFGIMYEEMMPYLDGTQTVKTTMEKIQSRGSVYMAEQYQ